MICFIRDAQAGDRLSTPDQRKRISYTVKSSVWPAIVFDDKLRWLIHGCQDPALASLFEKFERHIS